MVSAAQNLPTPSGLVAFGEVGLTGEVRATVGVQRRLAEAARLGFTRAIVPLADVVAGRAAVAEDRPRVFKCVGMSWQDLAVAAGVLEAADTP